METTGERTGVIPRGWPPEAHVVSCSKPIAITFLSVFGLLVGLVAWNNVIISRLHERCERMEVLVVQLTER